MICISSVDDGSCDILKTEYDYLGMRIREIAGGRARYSLGTDLTLSHQVSASEPQETRIEIEVLGERIGIRMLEDGQLYVNDAPALLDWSRRLPPGAVLLAVLLAALLAFVAALTVRALVDGELIAPGAVVSGTLIIVLSAGLIVPRYAWTLPAVSEGTVYYRFVISDRLGSGSVLLDEAGQRIRHTVFRPFADSF